MSSEELTSIEKNGNYWLSKSNTAYHIVNPNATATCGCGSSFNA